MSLSRRQRAKPFSNHAGSYTLEDLVSTVRGQTKSLDTLFQANGFAVRPQMSGAFELSQPFEQSWIVNACCRLWARNASSVKFKLYANSSEGAPEVPESDPVYQSLMRPNRDLTWAQLAEADVIHRKLCGESFWFIFGPQPTANGGTKWAPFEGPIVAPFVITPIQGSAVEYDPDEMGRPLRWYFQTASNSKVSALWSSVIQFRDYDPADPLRGLGAAEVANRQLQISFQAERQQEAQMRSGGPGAFITYEHDIQRDSLDAFQSDLDASTQDPETAGNLKILGGGPKIVPNPATPDRMQYVPLLQWSRDVVCSVFEVPVHLVSPDASTYSNLQEAWRQFWNAVVGYLKTVESQINSQLIPRLSDPRQRAYYFAFDFAGIEALRNDQSGRMKVAAEIAAATGIELGKIIAALGLDIDTSRLEDEDEDEEEDESAENETELEGEESEDEAETEAEQSAPAKTDIVADQALNGAQVASLLEILRAVSAGLLSPEGAVVTITSAFPFITPEQARTIVDGVQVAPQTAPEPAAEAAGAKSARAEGETQNAPDAILGGLGGSPQDQPSRRQIAQAGAKAVSLSVPAYMRASARRGLKLHEDGHSGEGLKPQTVEDARKMAAGQMTEEKWRKVGPWIARHIVDLEAVGEDEITPGLVAMLLWGGGSTVSSARRAQAYAEELVARIDAERAEAARALPVTAAMQPLTSREARMEYHRRFVAEVSEKHEARARRNVARWLAQYEREALKRLSKFANKARSLEEPSYTKGVQGKAREDDWIIEELLPDPTMWTKSLDRALSKVLDDAFKAAMKDQAAELGTDVVSMTDKRVREMLKKQKIEVVEGVHSTVAERVKNAIERNLDNPATFSDFAAQISSGLPDITEDLARVFGDKDGRANVIARTEINRAINSARDRQMDEDGVEFVQWVSERDDRVRESHEELDGETRRRGEEFKPGLRFPGDPKCPDGGEVINCRCVALAIVEPV